MLRQDINLYKAFIVYRPAAYFLAWKRLGYCVTAILLFYVAIYILSLIQLHYLNNRNDKLQQQVSALKSEFDNNRKQYPAFFFSHDVNLTINSLQEELVEQKKLLGSLALPVPFSRYLIALSATIVPDVWLTEITFSNRGDLINLKGKSESMEKLQQYINQLMKYPLFKSYVFNIDNITTVSTAKDNGNLIFELNMKKLTT